MVRKLAGDHSSGLLPRKDSKVHTYEEIRERQKRLLVYIKLWTGQLDDEKKVFLLHRDNAEIKYISEKIQEIWYEYHGLSWVTGDYTEFSEEELQRAEELFWSDMYPTIYKRMESSCQQT